MSSHEALEVVVAEIDQLLGQKAILTGLPPEPSGLHGPASKASITEMEKRLGRPFPASYRGFLASHNGWERFDSVFTLIGSSGAHTDAALQDIEETLRFYRIGWEERHGPATPAAIAAFEAEEAVDDDTEDGARLFLGTKLHFGTDFAGSLYFFNDRRVSEYGEPEVVYRDQNGDIIGRFDSLASMFRSTRDFLRKKVAELGTAKS